MESFFPASLSNAAVSWFWKTRTSAVNLHQMDTPYLVWRLFWTYLNVMNQKLAPIIEWRPLLDWLYSRLISFIHFIHLFYYRDAKIHDLCTWLFHLSSPFSRSMFGVSSLVLVGTCRFWGLFFNLLAPFVGALCISTLRRGVAGLFDPTNCLSGTTSSLV